MPKLPKSPKICQILQKSQFSSGSKSKKFHIERLVHFYTYSVHGVVHRNIKLSVYPRLFVFSLGGENGTNFRKSENVSWKPIFEVLYLLTNALKYMYPT